MERHSTHNSDMICAIVSCMFGPGGGLRGAECVFVARFSCPADSLARGVVGRYTRLLPSNTMIRDHDTQRLLSHTSVAQAFIAAAERAVPSQRARVAALCIRTTTFSSSSPQSGNTRLCCARNKRGCTVKGLSQISIYTPN